MIRKLALRAALPLGAFCMTTLQPGATASLQAIPVNQPADAGQTTRILNPGVISWVHFGDLHITSGDQQNYTDFKSIIANTNQYLLNGVNFAVLPGDNANEGSDSEYQLIKSATSQLKVPLYAVPGDHDRHDLAAYEKYMEARPYYSFSAAGYHFAFLDVMGGIDGDEKTWLTSDLAQAKAAGLKNVIFAHTYNVASDLQDVISRDDVIMLDAGHTHTNNVANDGHTIYAATRSTGQISEGPVGFSLVNLDNGVVSWKFKPLGSWPFVMITSPADKGLMLGTNQFVRGSETVRAKVWDDKGVSSVAMQVDGGTARSMQRIGSTQMWQAPYNFTSAPAGDHKIKVSVQGAGGNRTEDTITVAVASASTAPQLASRSFGPSTNSLGVYTEKGLLGNTAGGPGPGGPGGGARGGPSGRAAAAGPGPNGPGGSRGGRGGPGGPCASPGGVPPPPPPAGGPPPPPPGAAPPPNDGAPPPPPGGAPPPPPPGVANGVPPSQANAGCGTGRRRRSAANGAGASQALPAPGAPPANMPAPGS